MVLLNLITFDDKGIINFNFTKNPYKSATGIWTESYWYWFGYWKLHLGHDVYNIISDSVNFSISEIISILVTEGLAIELAVILAPFLLANWTLIKIFDNGNGIWIGWMWATSYMGYGGD